MRPRRTAAGAFTLVELMVTISILALLAGLLTPSVIAIKEVWDRTACETQLANIRMAIWAYASEVRMGRAAPPSDMTLLNRYQTGAECLAYFLLGPAATGHTVTLHGVTSTVQPFYTARPEEMRRTYDTRVESIGPNWMGLPDVTSDSNQGRVFVDSYSTMFGPHQAERTRPILYFAARPTAAADGNPYTLADNEGNFVNRNLPDSDPPDPLDWAADDYAAKFNAKMQYDKEAGTYIRGFILMSAGPDRRFFTDDDIMDYAERD